MPHYATGELVRCGDRVSLGKDPDGEVVCVVDSGEFTEAYPEADWSYLKKGVLIEFPMYGLIYYESTVEPDVTFISRETAGKGQAGITEKDGHNP